MPVVRIISYGAPPPGPPPQQYHHQRQDLAYNNNPVPSYGGGGAPAYGGGATQAGYQQRNHPQQSYGGNGWQPPAGQGMPSHYEVGSSGFDPTQQHVRPHARPAGAPAPCESRSGWTSYGCMTLTRRPALPAQTDLPRVINSTARNSNPRNKPARNNPSSSILNVTASARPSSAGSTTSGPLKRSEDASTTHTT